MRNPSVAILLPCYNQQEFIEESVRSAADQDYENLVVFIGDDGSTDNTRYLIESLALEYGERIFIVPDKKHLGITGNFSRLLKFCRQADFISFHAGDDVCLPGKIRSQVNWFIEHPNGVLCGHDSEYFSSSSNERLYLYSEKVPLKSGSGISYFTISPCLYDAISIMVRSSAILKYDFDQRIKVCSDFKLWLDILSSGGEYGFVDGIYTKHRIHSFNVTNDPYKNSRDMCEAYSVIAKDYPELQQFCKDNIVNFYLNLFWRAYLQEKNFKKAKFYLFRHLWINKFKFQQLHDLLGFKNKQFYYTIVLLFQLIFPELHQFIQIQKRNFQKHLY